MHAMLTKPCPLDETYNNKHKLHPLYFLCPSFRVTSFTAMMYTFYMQFYIYLTDKRPEDACVTTSQCETPTTAGDVHTTCPPQECDCTHTNIELTSEIESGRGEQQKTETSSCTGLGGGLGTLAGISVLILVGVILVWVWSCYRNGNKIK